MAEPGNQVISDRFPYVLIRLVVAGRTVEAEALLDTGFDGAVVIPATALGPETRPATHVPWTLADGTVVVAPVYVGVVRIGHLEPLRVVVTSLGSETLIGRSVSDRFHVTLDHGRRLVIEV